MGNYLFGYYKNETPVHETEIKEEHIIKAKINNFVPSTDELIKIKNNLKHIDIDTKIENERTQLLNQIKNFNRLNLKRIVRNERKKTYYRNPFLNEIREKHRKLRLYYKYHQ